MKVTDKQFYMDGYLKTNLDIAKQMVRRDFDFVMVIDGSEGSGKSVLAQQIGYYLDPSLTLERITFTPDEFKDMVLEAKPETCILLDEAFGALSSRRTMSLINIGIVDLLTEIRQKRLFIIIVLPTVFDLDRYVAMWRSRCLINVYLSGLERGQFAFYNQERKKIMLLKGRKTYSYHCIKPNFLGSFTNYYTVNEADYRKKKYESLRALKTQENKPSEYERLKSLCGALKTIGFKPTQLYNLWQEHDGVFCPSQRTISRWFSAK